MTEKNLPRGDIFDKERIKQQFMLVPVEHEPLTALVPKSWKLSDIDLPSPKAIDNAHLVALWGDPEGETGTLQIFVAQFSREISALHWLQRFAVAMEYEILQEENIAPFLADSLISFTVENHILVGRLVVRLYGNRVIAILPSSLADSYQELGELFGLLVRGVSAPDLTPGGPMEPRISLQLPTVFEFQMPASWSSHALQSSDQHLGGYDLVNLDTDGNSVGRIRIKWRWRTSPSSNDAEFAKLIQEFEEGGLRVGAVVYQQESGEASQSGFTVQKQKIHEATLVANPHPLEFRLVALTGDAVDLTMASLLPDPAHYPAHWAIGRRTFEVILETLRMLY